MNIFIHEDYQKEALRKIRRRQLIGIGLFVVSFILSIASFTPSTQLLIFLAYPFLLVGLPIWSAARATERRLQNSPRADSLINAELRGLNNKYSLHHGPRVGETWIPHLMITPSGLIVMASSDAVGPIRCTGTAKGDSWRSQTNILDRITGTKPPVGNPSVELDGAVAAARSLLGMIGKPEVSLKGLALFTRNPDIEIDGCAYGAAPLNELKLAVRDLELDMGAGREEGAALRSILTSDDRRKLNNLLAPVSIPAPTAAEKPAKPASARR